MPAFWDMTPAQRFMVMLLGAAAFGGIVYGISSRRVRRKITLLGPPECDEVNPDGGVVAGIRYLERVSAGSDPAAALPMVIMFHSRGATPESFGGHHHHLKGPARVITPAAPDRLGSGYSWFKLPARTDDQDELADQMEDAADTMANFISDIVRCRPTSGVPVVTGSSQGGSMAYLMASEYPQLVRGAVAILGWLPERLWNRYMAPTEGLHGVSDKTVPYNRTAQYAQAMQAAGAPFTFRSYDTGHAVSADMSRDWHGAVNRMLGYA